MAQRQNNALPKQLDLMLKNCKLRDLHFKTAKMGAARRFNSRNKS